MLAKGRTILSCERSANKFSGTAGIKAGISAIQGKFNSATGRMIGSLTRGVGRSATTTLRVIESFDGPSLNALGAVPVALEAGALLAAMRAGRRAQKLPEMSVPPEVKEIVQNEPRQLPAWVARFKERSQAGQSDSTRSQPQSSRSRSTADRVAEQVRRRAILAVGLLKLGQAAGFFAGTGLARLSRRSEPGITAGLEQQFFFPDSTRRPVRVWQSRLTPLFNRADAGISGGQRSDGLMVESQGQTWHRGTTVVKTTQGERTMTHLQSLTMPSTHYYFSRRLSDNETVGLITGQKGFEPKTLDGYAGQISEVESLLPAWAQTKRGLIQAHLRWGEQGRGTEQQRSGGAGSKGGFARERESEKIHPLDGVKTQVSLGGQDYPAMVRRVVSGPGGRPLAEATYYDKAAGVWKVVEDEAVRARLAEQVQAGQIEPWEKTEVNP
jgi:hypothetical protein